MTLTDKQYEALYFEAQVLGEAHGENAAGWWIQDALTNNRFASEIAHNTLQGLEDGDPMTLDSIPYPDLSGQWADTPNGGSIFAEIVDMANLGDEEFDDLSDGAEDDCLDEYEASFNTACQDAITVACIEYLEVV